MFGTTKFQIKVSPNSAKTGQLADLEIGWKTALAIIYVNVFLQFHLIKQYLATFTF